MDEEHFNVKSVIYKFVDLQEYGCAKSQKEAAEGRLGLSSLKFLLYLYTWLEVNLANKSIHRRRSHIDWTKIINLY